MSRISANCLGLGVCAGLVAILAILVVASFDIARSPNDGSPAAKVQSAPDVVAAQTVVSDQDETTQAEDVATTGSTTLDRDALVRDDGGGVSGVDAQFPARYARANENPQYPLFDDRLDEIRSRRSDSILSDREILDAMERERAWQSVDAAQARPVFSYLSDELFNDGRAFIRYDPLKFESTLRGDTVMISLPQSGQLLTLRILSIDTLEDTVRWTGAFAEFEGSPVNRFSLSQTLSGGYTAANIATPTGSYVLEAKEDVGYINTQENGFFLPEDGNDTIDPAD